MTDFKRHNELPDATVLWEMFAYDPNTGELASRDGIHLIYGRHGAVRAGYWSARRVIWKMMTGNDPILMGPSVDGTQTNHKWSNLRCVVNAPSLEDCPLYKP
jgi:hypothetical protein